MDINRSKLPYIILAIIGVMVIISAVRNFYFEDLLKGKTKNTFGIITKITSGTGVRQVSEVNYRYSVNNQSYSDNDNGDFNFMKVGDTILIKYSIVDPSVSEVVDKYYTKKYKHLKK